MSLVTGNTTKNCFVLSWLKLTRPFMGLAPQFQKNHKHVSFEYAGNDSSYDEVRQIHSFCFSTLLQD